MNVAYYYEHKAKMKDELDEARLKLSGHGGYNWLVTSPKAFWSVGEVLKALTGAGMQVSEDTITRWFHTLPHTQYFTGPGGLRASKNDLVQLFASQMGPEGRDRTRRSK